MGKAGADTDVVVKRLGQRTQLSQIMMYET